ncbi:hypothetical protein F4859DRAFT_38148 [Xylaria cf. heliscus]|nr:hypothetical protein F4859DRAFT_38148 [Xylaria cf. heliscus]
MPYMLYLATSASIPRATSLSVCSVTPETKVGSMYAYYAYVAPMKSSGARQVPFGCIYLPGQMKQASIKAVLALCSPVRKVVSCSPPIYILHSRVCLQYPHSVHYTSNIKPESPSKEQR